MTHDELLAKLDAQIAGSKVIGCECPACDNAVALRAVAELHKPTMLNSGFVICESCSNSEFFAYKDCETIQVIEKELL